MSNSKGKIRGEIERNHQLVTSSPTEFVYDEAAIFCECQKLSPRRTSWSDSNPGRCFYGCEKFQKGGCKFFKWYDPKMCDRARGLLKEFRDSEIELSQENEALRRKISNEMGYQMQNEEVSTLESGRIFEPFNYGSNSQRDNV
ncbi:hypothetical protein PTKIN_Ptkin02bG0151000 [Pterospermum kingtungense]